MNYKMSTPNRQILLQSNTQFMTHAYQCVFFTLYAVNRKRN